MKLKESSEASQNNPNIPEYYLIIKVIEANTVSCLVSDYNFLGTGRRFGLNNIGLTLIGALDFHLYLSLQYTDPALYNSNYFMSLGLGYDKYDKLFWNSSFGKRFFNNYEVYLRYFHIPQNRASYSKTKENYVDISVSGVTDFRDSYIFPQKGIRIELSYTYYYAKRYDDSSKRQGQIVGATLNNYFKIFNKLIVANQLYGEFFLNEYSFHSVSSLPLKIGRLYLLEKTKSEYPSSVYLMHNKLFSEKNEILILLSNKVYNFVFSDLILVPGKKYLVDSQYDFEKDEWESFIEQVSNKKLFYYIFSGAGFRFRLGQYKTCIPLFPYIGEIEIGYGLLYELSNSNEYSHGFVIGTHGFPGFLYMNITSDF